jgi:hypothetical protein
MCGLWKKVLPWQVSCIDGSWGAVCDNCARPFLIRLLRSRLPPTFSEVELLEIFCELGLGKKESELLFQDLQKDIIRTRGKGFSLFDDEPAVVRLGSEPKNARKRYRKPTSEEIFLRCVKLSRGLLEEEKR